MQETFINNHRHGQFNDGLFGSAFELDNRFINLKNDVELDPAFGRLFYKRHHHAEGWPWRVLRNPLSLDIDYPVTRGESECTYRVLRANKVRFLLTATGMSETFSPWCRNHVRRAMAHGLLGTHIGVR